MVAIISTDAFYLLYSTLSFIVLWGSMDLFFNIVNCHCTAAFAVRLIVSCWYVDVRGPCVSRPHSVIGTDIIARR